MTNLTQLRTSMTKYSAGRIADMTRLSKPRVLAIRKGAQPDDMEAAKIKAAVAELDTEFSL